MQKKYLHFLLLGFSILSILAYLYFHEQDKAVALQKQRGLRGNIDGLLWRISEIGERQKLEISKDDKVLLALEGMSFAWPHFSNLKNQDINGTDQVIDGKKVFIIEERQADHGFTYHFFQTDPFSLLFRR